MLFAFLGCLLCGLSGLAGGYFYATQKTYELPKDFFKMYVRGLREEEKETQAARTPQKIKKRK